MRSRVHNRRRNPHGQIREYEAVLLSAYRSRLPASVPWMPTSRPDPDAEQQLTPPFSPVSQLIRLIPTDDPIHPLNTLRN
jgi:hypothetical protein